MDKNKDKDKDKDKNKDTPGSCSVVYWCRQATKKQENKKLS